MPLVVDSYLISFSSQHTVYCENIRMCISDSGTAVPHHSQVKLKAPAANELS